MSENEPNETPEQATPPVEETPTAGEAAPAPVDPASISTDDKNIAMLAHLLGLLGFLGPLIVWLIKKDQSPFIDQEGKESLNFQITVVIAYVALIPISVITCGFGGILYLPIFICVIIFCILAALKAKEGESYRYPLTIRLVK
ncbi:MAG: DUF4870 domain-containing protein [Planctomycetota bacterium]